MLNLLLAQTNTTSSFVILGVFVVLMIVMLVFPTISNKKKMAAYKEMQEGLKTGDKIQTIGGIVGRLIKIKDKDGYKTIVLETGDKDKKMYIEFDINAIAGIVTGQPNTTQVAKTDTESTVVSETVEPEIIDVDFDAEIENKKANETSQTKAKKKK